MRKKTVLLPILFTFLLFNCKGKKTESADSVGGTNTETAGSNTDEAAKTYSVTEFVDIYTKKKSSLEGETVVVEGYCTGYVPLKTKDKGIAGYRVPLSANQEHKFSDKKVFFLFNGNTDKEDFLRPFILKKKLKIKGRVTDEELFDKPVLADAEVIG